MSSIEAERSDGYPYLVELISMPVTNSEGLRSEGLRDVGRCRGNGGTVMIYPASIDRRKRGPSEETAILVRYEVGVERCENSRS